MINISRVHSITQGNVINQSTKRHYLYGFHRRYWKIDCISTQSYDLLATRILAIFMWLYVLIITLIAYSNTIKPSTIILNFLFGSSISLREISAILYASGTAAYGVSIEIYLILPLVIINFIMIINNCSINHRETIASIMYIGKALAFLVSTELSYQNFKRFKFHQSYELYYQKASRAILRQSIYLIITIIFLVSPGLRSIYSAAQFKCPYSNTTFNESQCSIIDIERPVSEEHATCVADYTALITSMEQLRIIRNIVLCSIAFYSTYNKGFLDLTGKTTVIHKMMLLLFFAISCSVLVVNTDPLRFSQMKIYFNIIEIIFFIIMMVLLIINLRKKYEHRKYVIMAENPTIFG